MAIVKVPQNSTIAIKLQKGITSAGSPAYVTRNYPGKPSATDQDLFDVAVALMGLQAYPLVDIARVDNSYLLSE